MADLLGDCAKMDKVISLEILTLGNQIAPSAKSPCVNDINVRAPRVVVKRKGRGRIPSFA
jgi:Flp pilus assembly CpaF family ATPase